MAQRLAGETGARRVDDDDVRRARALQQLLDDLADVAGEERGVRDAVQLGVLERARDRLLRDLDPPHRQRVLREREPDRADAAVEIPDRLGAGELRRLARERVQLLGHRGVRLEERVRPHAETQPVSSSSIHGSPQSSCDGRFVTSAGVSLIDQWIDFTSGNLRSTSTK